ncbi:MAG: uroporphyrinogen decarboxylase family protein [Candidatus Limivivens sp.]|nr:uroporphyrinogen decarboxylase family protein [Candidatus Limivivens sp.]
MRTIKKAPETMSSKERVMRTFAFEKTDRVPIDYSANPAIHERFCQALGISGQDEESLFEILGVDYRAAGAEFIGENRFPVLPGRKTHPIYGYNMRWAANEKGGYWDFCDFPLKDADDETIANFYVPDPDQFSVKDLRSKLQKVSDKAVYIGHPGIADIINSTGRVMGMEDTLVNLFSEDEATLTYVNRVVAMQLGVLEMALEEAGDLIDFVWMGEDLGTQRGPMISMEMYRKVLQPIHQKYIDLAKAYNKPIMMHTCGSSSWAYEEFIKMGIDAVDTLQPEPVNMSPRYLKDHFGGRLSFHGCISTTGPLTYGTPEEIEQNVKDTLEIMMPGGGYHFATTHMIQDNTPVENLFAMYQAVHTYGSPNW